MPLTLGGKPVSDPRALSDGSSLGDLYSDPSSAPAAAPVKRGGWKIPAAIAVAGQMADLGSTAAALKNPNLTETNPLMSDNMAVQALVKTGLSVGVALMIKKLADEGHPAAAKIMGSVIGGIGGAAALSNLYQLKKAKEKT